MPRQTRKPLATQDPNVVTNKPDGSRKGKANVIFNEAPVKPEAVLTHVEESNVSEVEKLRAQVDDLTAKLAAATLGSTISVKTEDVKPVITKSITSSVTPITAAGPIPKRPPTAYNLFMSDHRDGLRKSNPELSLQEVNAKLAEMWKNASEEQRSEYENALAPMKERFAEEKAAHDARLAAIKEETEAMEWMKNREAQARAMELYEAHLAEEAQKKEKETSKTVDEKKPKKARSAYLLYQMYRHAEMAKHKDGKPENAQAVIADEWHALSKSRRVKDRAVVKKFVAAAEEDQVRYREEMAAYEEEQAARAEEKSQKEASERALAVDSYRKHKQQEAEIDSLRRMQVEQKKQEKADKAAARAAKKAEKEKKANEPKRALTAYQMFFSEVSKDPEVKKEAQAEGASLFGVVGGMWKNVSEEDKKKYVDMAEADKERYQREKAAMKN